MSPWEGAGESFAATTGKMAGMGGGVMQFDRWNEDFWKGMNDYEMSQPGAQNKNNSCNAADPIEPN